MTLGEELRIPTEGAVLAATLELPDGEGPFPVVVGMQGPSTGTRHDRLCRHLHELLPPAGVAALTFDRRGEGASTGEPDAPLERLAADVRAVVASLAGRAGCDPRRIGLWAFGQGGWIASMAAAEDPLVAFLVLVSACAVTPGRQMAYAAAHRLREHGYDDDVIRRVGALRRTIDEAYRAGDPGRVAARVDAVRGEPWFALAHLPDPAARTDDGWTLVVDLDISPLLRRLRVPVLLVHGDEDRWVPVSESLAVWRHAYRGPRLEVVRLAGAGHVPTRPLVDADPDGERPLAAEYERALLAFLALQAGG